MNAIADLDPHITQMARTLLEVSKPAAWQNVQVRTRITPDGSTSTQSFELRDTTGQSVKGWYPPDAAMDRLFDLARECWKVAATGDAPPWYGMTVSVQSNGRFNADFEYRENYQEGDISRER